VITKYVLDTGALVAAERGKQRVLRFFQQAERGRAQLLVPLPVIAEWWRGRSDDREAILAAAHVVASVEATKDAGVTLAKIKDPDATLTIDAVVIAIAAHTGAIVLTGDVADFDRLRSHFPRVTILSV